MATKKLRKRCSRCGRRLIVEKLQFEIPWTSRFFICIDQEKCKSVQSSGTRKEDTNVLINVLALATNY